MNLGELEIFEDLARAAHPVLQGHAVRVHVDVDVTAPGIDLHLEKAGHFGRKPTLTPVLLVEDVGVVAFKVEGPAMKAAAEILAVVAPPVMDPTRLVQAGQHVRHRAETGRSSCRESVWQYVK